MVSANIYRKMLVFLNGFSDKICVKYVFKLGCVCMVLKSLTASNQSKICCIFILFLSVSHKHYRV